MTSEASKRSQDSELKNICFAIGVLGFILFAGSYLAICDLLGACKHIALHIADGIYMVRLSGHPMDDHGGHGCV